MPRLRIPLVLLILLGLALAGPGCSVRRLAINKVADALSGGGTTFTSDDDPELVRDALPFSLKLVETLITETPRHRGLLLTAASGFTQYGYAFVQQDADRAEATDFAAAEGARSRVKRLYLRARNYGLRGLEAAHPGLTNALLSAPRAALASTVKADVPFLYWTAAAWGAAISVGKDDAGLVADIPQMEALIDRALELDEAWGDGSIHAFLITYEMSRQGGQGDPARRARAHFERALQLARGRLAAPYVALAESVCVEQQKASEFRELLQQALAVDADAHPDFRLANTVLQRRARWLLDRQEDLFLAPPPPAGSTGAPGK